MEYRDIFSSNDNIQKTMRLEIGEYLWISALSDFSGTTEEYGGLRNSIDLNQNEEVL
jgi:hypothetical protein